MKFYHIFQVLVHLHQIFGIAFDIE